MGQPGDPGPDHAIQAALGRAVIDGRRVVSWSTAPLGHRVENLTTASLERVRASLDDGGTLSLVAKTLHPASSSPMFASIPPEHHAQVLEDLDWLVEPGVYRCGLSAGLPAPMRMAAVHHIDTAAPDRITIYLEDVADEAPWDLARYGRTAEALGALGGRWCPADAQARFDLRPRPIARLFFGKIVHHDLSIQSDDAFWDDPTIAAVTDAQHRHDLMRLAAAVPLLLDRLASVPRGVCHGDAAPDNFREPSAAEIVALDWSYAHVGERGSDLAQLLAGRFDSGAADPDDVEPIAGVILDGYCTGLAREGADVDRRSVETAWAVHLAIRSVFSALVVDHRPDLDEPGRRALLRRRARVARFGIDLGLRIAGGAAPEGTAAV